MKMTTTHRVQLQ